MALLMVLISPVPRSRRVVRARVVGPQHDVPGGRGDRCKVQSYLGLTHTSGEDYSMCLTWWRGSVCWACSEW